MTDAATWHRRHTRHALALAAALTALIASAWFIGLVVVELGAEHILAQAALVPRDHLLHADTYPTAVRIIDEHCPLTIDIDAGALFPLFGTPHVTPHLLLIRQDSRPPGANIPPGPALAALAHDLTKMSGSRAEILIEGRRVILTTADRQPSIDATAAARRACHAVAAWWNSL